MLGISKYLYIHVHVLRLLSEYICICICDRVKSSVEVYSGVQSQDGWNSSRVTPYNPTATTTSSNTIHTPIPVIAGLNNVGGGTILISNSTSPRPPLHTNNTNNKKCA